jgi:hypothetical protein
MWRGTTERNEFYVHDSVHLGNIYVQFKVQLDVLFYVYLFFFVVSSTCLAQSEIDLAKSVRVSQPVPAPMQ